MKRETAREIDIQAHVRVYVRAPLSRGVIEDQGWCYIFRPNLSLPPSRIKINSKNRVLKARLLLLLKLRKKLTGFMVCWPTSSHCFIDFFSPLAFFLCLVHPSADLSATYILIILTCEKLDFHRGEYWNGFDSDWRGKIQGRCWYAHFIC